MGPSYILMITLLKEEILLDIFIEAFKRYMNTSNTSYAINLNGAWGIGKTHFVKSKIKEILDNDFPEYSMIYISLNGVKDVNEIGENVFLQLVSPTTAKGYVQPRGGEVAFYNRQAIFQLQIDKLKPGKLVEWTALHDMPAWKGTKIRFDLTVNDNGATILNFNHTGFESMEGSYPMINTTWGSLMYILKQFVEGKNPGAWHQAQKYYVNNGSFLKNC